MPVFTVPIQQQVQASGGGSKSGMTFPSISQGTIWYEAWLRTTLNPAAYPALYVNTAGAGTGTSSILSTGQLQILNSGALNDNTTLVAQEVGLKRNTRNPVFDNRSTLQIEISFYVNSASQIQTFVGILQSNTAITALPTTAKHMGVYLDTGVSNNFKLSSADGTTQTTTDTGIAVAANTLYRISIIWTGGDSATLNFYTGNNPPTTLAKSVNVTALLSDGGVSPFPYFAQWFVKNLVASAKGIFIVEWGYSAF